MNGPEAHETPVPGDLDAPEPEGGAGEALPDAPLFALLRSIEVQIGPRRIDGIWIFPPRRLELGETAAVIVAAFPDDESDRRRVFAAHYTVAADAAQPRLVLDEVGTAPTDRVGRVVEDVAERIKDEPAAAPHAARIEGDPVRWHELLHSLAERFLDDTLYPARPRRFVPPSSTRRGPRNQGSSDPVGGGHSAPA